MKPPEATQKEILRSKSCAEGLICEKIKHRKTHINSKQLQASINRLRDFFLHSWMKPAFQA